jgi:hypothetical protein
MKINFSLVVLLISIQTIASASPLAGHADRDMLREFYIENILNIKPSMVTLSSDLRMIRYALNNSDVEANRIYPPIHKVPLVRIFSDDELTLGNLVKLAGLTSNFEVVIHPNVDQDEKITINQNFNSLIDVAQYLDHVSSAEVGIANESRTIIVMPSKSRARILNL